MEYKEDHTILWILGAFLLLSAVLAWGQQIMDHYPKAQVEGEVSD